MGLAAAALLGVTLACGDGAGPGLRRARS